MRFSFKKEEVLLSLYEKRFDGSYYDILEILEKKHIEIANSESIHIGKSLAEDGFMAAYLSKDGCHGEITSSGVEYVEEFLLNNKLSDFTDSEINIINANLDQLLIRIQKLELGQEIIYEDLVSDINELRELAYRVKKKTWFEILKGKMITFGFGELTERGFKLIKEIFGDSKFLN